MLPSSATQSSMPGFACHSQCFSARTASAFGISSRSCIQSLLFSKNDIRLRLLLRHLSCLTLIRDAMRPGLSDRWQWSHAPCHHRTWCCIKDFWHSPSGGISVRMGLSCTWTGVGLAYPGHHKVADLHLFPRLMEALPKERLPVIPLAAAKDTFPM